MSAFRCPDELAFSGDLDGNGHSVSNVTFTGDASRDAARESTTWGIGLFGSTHFSDIRNLRLRNVTLDEGDSAGGRGWGMLVGILQGGSVTGVSVEGTINAPQVSRVGGLVGNADGVKPAGAVISSSSVVSDSIVGDTNVGGLVGNAAALSNDKLAVEIRSSLAVVKSLSSMARGSIGGLVGAAPTVDVSSSLAVVGTISGGGSIGNSGAGGLLGSGRSAEMDSSLALTRAIASAGAVHGLVAGTTQATVADSYWHGGVSLTAADGMTTKAAAIGTVTSDASATATQLRSPVGFTGIYADWGDAWCNPDTGAFMAGSASPGDGYVQVWDFGTDMEYPVIACFGDRLTMQRMEVTFALEDLDGDEIPDNVDIDMDGDGLIELDTEAELAAMRFDLTGASLDTTDNGVADGVTTGCGGGMDNNGDDITACSGYELADDMDLDGFNSNNWIPVGSCGSTTSCSETLAFSGDFNGNGHSVSNLTITRTGSGTFYGVGLFGSTQGSDIRNLQLLGVTMTGGATTRGEDWGMLVGNMKGGSITGVSAEGTINAPGIRDVGGLVGQTGRAGGTITSSSVVSDSIAAENLAGGLLGQGSDGEGVKPPEIRSSLAIVTSLSATTGQVGGLIAGARKSKVSSSLAVAGSVSSTNAGGLVGFGHLAEIASSLALAKSIDGSNTVGGIAAWGGDMGPVPESVADSYWDSDTVSFTDGSGGTKMPQNHGTGKTGVGKTTTKLQSPTTFTGDYASWGNAWCHPGTGEYKEATSSPGTGYVQVWNLGEDDEYPVINCVRTKLPVATQRTEVTDALTP